MSHVLAYDGQFFRVEIAEVVGADGQDKTHYVGWCSEAFKRLSDMPSQSLSRFVEGPALQTHAEARLRTYEWIKNHWDRSKAKGLNKPQKKPHVVYSVWLFHGEKSTSIEFLEYADARAFAAAAEKSTELTKIGITDNESPQYLSIWERKGT